MAGYNSIVMRFASVEETVAVERALNAVANGRIAMVYDHIAVALTEASQVAGVDWQNWTLNPKPNRLDSRSETCSISSLCLKGRNRWPQNRPKRRWCSPKPIDKHGTTKPT
jgi:hypothetical protein